MLSGEHAIVDYDRGRAIPDRLVTGRHGHYLGLAERMLGVYRHGAALARQELHRRVQDLFVHEDDCPPRRIQAFCKLLDDRGEFQEDRRGEAARLRLRVFAAAARCHPLVSQPDRLFEHAEAEVKARLAAELEMDWPAVEAALYADVIGYQRLVAFEGYPDAASLLSRYNVAQLQACLYGAQGMTIEAGADFKTILRYAKLARLLHEIVPRGPSRYRIELSGPASVLRGTRRYGVNFARFLPALLACRDWRMRAALVTPWKAPATLTLSDADGFKSHLPAPAEFDSQVEEAFAAKFGPRRDGWQLIREGEILQDAQTVFLPDFVFRHEDGTQVLMEVVGFWTWQYLAHKRRTLRRFAGHRILLAVYQSLLKGRTVRGEADSQERPGRNVLVYKSALKICDVLEALERMRVGKNDQ